MDITVAARALQPGDLALRIPEQLIVTLDGVFENNTLSEMLTTNKLSELACLTLYLCYEKKRGPKSTWWAFIKELDRTQARGPQVLWLAALSFLPSALARACVPPGAAAGWRCLWLVLEQGWIPTQHCSMRGGAQRLPVAGRRAGGEAGGQADMVL